MKIRNGLESLSLDPPTVNNRANTKKGKKIKEKKQAGERREEEKHAKGSS